MPIKAIFFYSNVCQCFVYLNLLGLVVYDGLVVLDAVLEFPVPLEQGLAQLRGQLQVYNNKQCSFSKKTHKSLDWNSNKYYI